METPQIQDEDAGKTLAAIVSFNGGNNTLRLIDRLLLMVGCVYIVDNGSSAYSKNLLATRCADSNVEILFLPENCGIGAALNFALEYAHDHNYKWIITFDQDSMPSLTMLQNFFNFHRMQPNSFFFTPRLVSHKHSIVDSIEYSNSVVPYAITSGNMFSVEEALKVGGYDESYFIDCVDFEFSLRLRQGGNKIYRVGSAAMAHGVGDETSIPTFLKRFYTSHSATRRYYQHRNLIFIIRSYSTTFPYFCLKLLVGQFIQVLMLVAIENNRKENVRNILLGLRDGFLGRGGRLRLRHEIDNH